MTVSRAVRKGGPTLAFAIVWLAAGVARSDGPVVGWGWNLDGQLTLPASVDGTTGTASAIAAGVFDSCAIQSASGAVLCWGRDDNGGAVPPASVDGTTGAATAIAAGTNHSCASWSELTRAEQERWIAAYRTYVAALTEAGVLRGSGRLQASSTATTVRAVNGQAQVLDGPYADAKEQLGGYFLVDVPDLDAALSWAARCPAADHGIVEVRPLWLMPGSAA